MASTQQESDSDMEEFEDALEEMVIASEEAEKDKLRTGGVNSLSDKPDSKEDSESLPEQTAEKVTDSELVDNLSSAVKNLPETKGESVPAGEQERGVSQRLSENNENAPNDSSAKDTPACDNPAEDVNINNVKVSSDCDVTKESDSSDSPGNPEESSCGASSLDQSPAAEAAEDNLDDAGSDSEEEEEEPEEDVEQRKQREDEMAEEERESLKLQAQLLKTKGNSLFKEDKYEAAVEQYTDALHICPLYYAMERSIMYSNRAACKLHLERNKSAIEDCSKALELNPRYLKALFRRAELYEKTEKLDEALVDYQRVVEMDPSQHAARQACMRLPEQIKERNEKMKEEMMGKLKELGNMILKPFGLSTNNFQLQQDPNSGGYSVNFSQNPGGGQ